MKALSLLVICIFLTLAACAPKSGSDSDKNSSSTEEGGSQTGDSGPSSNPNGGGTVNAAKHDCGADVIADCPLFGLSSNELMETRDLARERLKVNDASLKLNSPQEMALQSARLLSFVKQRYPKVSIELNDDLMKDYAEYLFSTVQN